MSYPIELFVFSFAFSFFIYKIKNADINWAVIIKNTFYTWTLSMILTIIFHK
jgi:hypothetical protein